MKPICEIEPILKSVEGFDCPVEAAKTMLQSARSASCGKGLMCRDGLSQLEVIIDEIRSGHGQDEDIALMREICDAALVFKECGLSVAVVTWLRDSLKQESEIWQRHIGSRLCDALVCFYSVHISPERCVGCGACAEACPKDCVAGGEGLIHIIDVERCDGCLLCAKTCQNEAVVKAGMIKPQCPLVPQPVGSFQARSGLGKRRKNI